MAKKMKRVKVFWALSNRLTKYRMKTVGNVLSSIAFETFTILSAGISAYMVALALRGNLTADHHYLFWVLLGCIAGFGIFRYLESWLSHDVAFHILVDYRVAMYNAFEKVCPDILLERKSGQLSVTLMNDVEILEWFFGHTVGIFIASLTVALGILGFLGWLHPVLLLVMLICIAIIFSIPLLFQGEADTQGILNRYKLGDANSVTLEGLNGIKEILVLNYKARYLAKNNAFMDELTTTQVAYAKRQGLEGGLLLMAAGLSSIAMNITGVVLTLQGALSIEWFAVIGTTIWLAFTPILSVCDKARSFGIIYASAVRVYEVLQSTPIVQDDGKDVPVSEIAPSITFDHVSFRYKKAAQDTVSDVSFHIEPGEMVALVGHSGAGKTTCTNLLMRFWGVQKGSIRIGGHDIRTLSLKTLNSLTGAVLQDVYLFNTSIMENIRLGKPHATEEDVITAAKQAQAHVFIMDLEEGYHTVCGERGAQLSGGQKQRIAIARALLTDAPILIFDEAVSNLDTKSERDIQDVLRILAKHKTVVMVAHRLSTIMSADRVIVFERGQVVQIGKHSTLIQENGYYQTLIASQCKATGRV